MKKSYTTDDDLKKIPESKRHEFRVWLKPQELVVDAAEYYRDHQFAVFSDDQGKVILTIPIAEIDRIICGDMWIEENI